MDKQKTNNYLIIKQINKIIHGQNSKTVSKQGLLQPKQVKYG